ncbi:MAG: hypothetical protein LH478_01440 [Chitinophagaceae bacterium]|nr:hypothetical protein [Chitinophagaceae bacterium]
MHDIRANVNKILEVIKGIIGDEVSEKGSYLRRGTRPGFSDMVKKSAAIRTLKRTPISLL